MNNKKNARAQDELILENERLKKETARLNEIIVLNEKAETRLIESENKYENLLRIVPDTIYKLDEEGFFTYISDSISNIGYKPSELIGKHFSIIVHPDDVPYVSRSFVLPKLHGKNTGYTNSPKLFDERRSGTRITKCLEIRLLPKGWEDNQSDFIIGSIFSCGEIDSAGHYDDNGNTSDMVFVGTIGVIRDITDKKKSEENFNKTQRLKSLGILAGGIAHDFNNILTAIVGNITLIKLEVDPGSTIFQSLNDAEKATLRAKDLTNQLLTFAKGGTPVKNAASIAQLTMDISNFTLRGSNVKCNFDFPENLWPVDIDEGQISQVINNLIINASQAMPGGGCINISAENMTVYEPDAAELYGRYVKLKIMDTGMGISKENLQRIFDPYFTTKAKGSGLGLTTSYSIIKSHGGSITAESEPGKGTIFDVILPASDKIIAQLMNTDMGTMDLTGKILLMDDDTEILKATGNILENFGYNVTIAENGEEAIDHFRREFDRSEGFDLVIMDLTVPGGLGGKEAIKIIKEIDPDIMAVVTSGYSNDPIIEEYRKHGFHGVVVKPYKLEQLINTVAGLLKGKC